MHVLWTFQAHKHTMSIYIDRNFHVPLQNKLIINIKTG